MTKKFSPAIQALLACGGSINRCTIDVVYPGRVRIHAYNHESKPKTVYIESIRTPKTKRGKGYGTRALTEFCKWADEHQIALELFACPYDGNPMGMDDLRDWYKKFGFRHRGWDMRRTPKRKSVV